MLHRIRALFPSDPDYPEFLDAWDELLDEQMMHWGQLTDDEQERLEDLTLLEQAVATTGST